MLNPARKIHWQQAPMPADAVLLGTRAGLRLGRPWKWAIVDGEDAMTTVLLAFDSRKQEFRIWQLGKRHDTNRLHLRVEHHGHAPGWHAHNARPKVGALTAPRQDIAADRFPLLENTHLWAESANERIRALFPFEPIRGANLSDIANMLTGLSPETAVQAVPFGAGVGLPFQMAQGDSLGFYIAQLGRRTPLFRLEDDGTTIPILQAAGHLAFSEQLDPRTILRESAARDFYFGPDNRAIFTPFFPFDELLDRARLFVSTLKALWNRLDTAAAAGGPLHEDEAISAASSA